MNNIRTRFAPSPTGFLHVGGLRTALYAYLIAKQSGGDFLLRIEDTDRSRLVDGAVESLVHSLEWAGLDADEGFRSVDGSIEEIGDSGPYMQSVRKEHGVYQQYVDQLIEAGYAYYAFDTAEELDAMRERQEIAKLAPRYDRMNMRNSLTLSPEETADAMNGDYVVRMIVPENETITFTDAVRGELSFRTSEVDDQVLLKSDGFPTYHLAVVVDDHHMGITHVIRGEEWISSTPKHVLLYRYLGWEMPTIAHLSLMVNEQGKKLSKRHGDVSVEDFKEKGYLRETMINFLALVGWNPGTEQELFTLDELVQTFSLDRVQKSSGVFDVTKLNWMNKQWMMQLDVDDLTRRAIPFFKRAGLLADSDIDDGPEFERLKQIVKLEVGRAETLAEIPANVGFIFASSLEYDAELLIWKKSTREDAKEKLEAVRDYLNDVDENNWSLDSLQEPMIAWIKENEWGNGDVLWPMRVALSGLKNSPSPFEIASVLGKDETLRRIEISINALS
jgi:nondiscriminating glutamyl-tRNA synthetase